MAKKRGTIPTKQRASVGRELRLALALRGLLEALRDVAIDWKHEEGVTEAELDANNVLGSLGYENLVGVRSRIRSLNEQLKTAVESGDGAEIARLGNELSRAQQGKPPLKSPAPPAVKRSSRSGGAKSSTVSTATETEGAGSADGE